MSSRQQSRQNGGKTAQKLQMLSTKEKFQLMELQKTRERIVAELGQYPSSTINYNFGTFGQPGGFDMSMGFTSTASLAGMDSSRNDRRGGVKLSKTANYIEKMKIGLDMIPLLASTGEPALEVGLNKTGRIKLPVFKLPTIDHASVSAVESRREIERLQQSTTTKMTTTASNHRLGGSGGGLSEPSYQVKFLYYRDLSTFKMALLAMLNTLDMRGLEVMKRYLYLSDTDINDVELILSNDSSSSSSSSSSTRGGNTFLRPSTHNIALDSTMRGTTTEVGTAAGGRESPSVGVGTTTGMAKHQLNVFDLLSYEESCSVFVKAGDVVSKEKSSGRGSAGQRNISSLFSYAEFQRELKIQTAAAAKPGTSMSSSSMMMGAGDSGINNFNASSSLRVMSSQKKATLKLSSLSPLGLTADFSEFITDNQNVGSTADFYSSRQQQKNNKGRNNNKRNGKLNKSNRSRSVQNMRTSSSIMASSEEAKDTSSLATELIESLRKMEKHTTKVKKGIAQLQHMVSLDQNSDPRARTALCSVGAEQMDAALRKLVRTDLRRGLMAWAEATFEQRCEGKCEVTVRFLTIRNLILGLQRLTHKVLTHSFAQWINFTMYENERIMKHRVLHATIMIQKLVRGRIGRKKAGLKAQRRKYERLYDSTILIQALMRGSYTRWKLQEKLKLEKVTRASIFIQRCLRGYRARKRVYTLLMRRNKGMAATIIQKRVRGIAGRVRVDAMRELRERNRAAVKIQAIIRGFVARRTIEKRLIDRARSRYAIKIQSLMRGVLARKNIHRRIQAIEDYKQLRLASIVKIQSCYRGYKGRKVLRMVMFKLRKKKDVQFKAATKIITMVRGFMARAYLRDLKIERLNKWVEQARQWQEMWSDDSEQWFYLHAETGESLWEPAKEGYTKFDGRLVLQSGAIIDDPRNAMPGGEDGSIGGGEGEDSSAPKKGRNRLCSECVDRVAIRNCNECGDKFCTKCYKATHATGTRRNHTYTATGPIDCTECELVLADRFCVSCDESYCDTCWRKVHSHGKRRFHAYSDVSTEGRIDSHIFTMDGEELNQYDSTYAQQKQDQEGAKQYGANYTAPNTAAATGDYGDYSAYGGEEYADYYAGAGAAAAGAGEGEEWTEYADDQGYPYWYNNVTGVSQYENPYEGY